jgi:tetratricopeptide (TPR) repeat protein
MKKIKIFVSYSHQNEDWVSREGKYKLIPWLEKQLSDQAEIWTDHALKELIGEEYTRLIKEKILDAEIALLLISQDFVTSQFILEIELQLIKQLYLNEKLKIIPLLITNLSKSGKERISWIFDLQTYPNDTKPLISFVNNDADWENIKIEILDGIENKIESLRDIKTKTTINNSEKKSDVDQGNTKIDKQLVLSNTAKEFFNLGDEAYEHRFYELAIDYFEKAVLKNPFYEYAFNYLGASYKNTGEYDKSISAFEKAIEIKPKYANAYFNLASLFDETCDYDKAISAYKKVISIKPEYADAYYNMGITYRKNGEFDKSIAAYQKAIAIKPAFAEAYNNMGIAYGMKGEFEKAMAVYLKAIAIKPDCANAFYNKELAVNAREGNSEPKECQKKGLKIGHKGSLVWLKENYKS